MSRSTLNSLADLVEHSTGVASTTPSCAAVGGTDPGLEPREGREAVPRRTSSARAWTSRTGALGRTWRGSSGRRRRWSGDQLDDDDAAHATDDLGPARHVDAAALDQGAVGPAEPGPLVEQGVEVLAAVLLLALDQEPDPARQRPIVAR